MTAKLSSSVYPRITDARLFGKVAVLYGGDSAEREVSLQSGEAVLNGLLRSGVDCYALDKDGNLLKRLKEQKFDRVFLVLHGRGGEDGTIQGALDTAGIPYTGSKVMGSALSMNKNITKLVWKGLNLPTPDYRIVNDKKAFKQAIGEIGLPVFVKPVDEGSSVGAMPVHDLKQLDDAWTVSSQYNSPTIVERFIDGIEYTVGILHEQALPVIRLQPAREFYDYIAKYSDGAGTLYHCPSGLTSEQENDMRRLALQAYVAVGATGWGRVDLINDADNQSWLIEVNTIPGMTSHSLVPMAAQASALDFDTLVWRILETSMV